MSAIPADRLAPFDLRAFWGLVLFGSVLVGSGLAAAHYMEANGHAVTGMNNQIVWGLPHVFAIFMILCASGVLNVASVGSVFGQSAYKARAPLSGLLSLALLAGGLMVLLLDLGRPDRIIVAATHYNFRSVFAWNVVLYSGLFGLVGIYLWTMMERRMGRFSKAAGIAVLIWRFILTTGTGSIFAFLVARQAYQSAVLAPMFIMMSLAWGLAVFLIVQSVLYAWNGVKVPPEVQARLTRLLGVFVVATLYLVAIYHLTNLYQARQGSFERFILLEGGIFPALFWLGYVLLGTALPLGIIYRRSAASTSRATLAAAALVLLGAFSFIYVFIIGGQAFPLEIVPGYVLSSRDFDGQIASYRPSLPELLLGLGGAGAAFLVTTIGVRILPFMPDDAVYASAPMSKSER